MALRTISRGASCCGLKEGRKTEAINNDMIAIIAIPALLIGRNIVNPFRLLQPMKILSEHNIRKKNKNYSGIQNVCADR
jgi:hypothetical protein